MCMFISNTLHKTRQDAKAEWQRWLEWDLHMELITNLKKARLSPTSGNDWLASEEAKKSNLSHMLGIWMTWRSGLDQSGTEKVPFGIACTPKSCPYNPLTSAHLVLVWESGRMLSLCHVHSNNKRLIPGRYCPRVEPPSLTMTSVTSKSESRWTSVSSRALLTNSNLAVTATLNTAVAWVGLDTDVHPVATNAVFRILFAVKFY